MFTAFLTSPSTHQVWHNISIVRNYFQRFNIPLVTNDNGAARSLDFDFRTGTPVNVTHPAPEAVGAAFAKYAAFLAQYPEIDRGMFLPNPVPEDLLMPFGALAKKYDFEAILENLWITNQGAGNLLTIPTVENMRIDGLSLIQQVLTNALLTTARHNNSELYTAAQAELLAANALLLSSEVKHSSRTDHGVELIVQTPHGKKLICAKKLLITIPPRLKALRPFDLDRQERSVFAKLVDAGYYTSLVKNTGIPDDVVLPNYAPNTPYNLPPLPGAYIIAPTGVPGLKAIYYGSERSLPDARVKADIISTVKRLQAKNTGMFNQTEPEFVVYSSHAPFYLRAKPGDISEGVYVDMYALQGLRSTWWTGAAWRAQDSSMLWRFNEEVVLPELLKGL
jgi:hypothetical protein